MGRTTKKSRSKPIKAPRYRGLKWIDARLPERLDPWLQGIGKSDCPVELRAAVEWKWPKRPLYFISDLHADADAFIASLVASGGVEKTGPADHDLKLTRKGRKARFVIGGDCFDKGPSSLRLLRVIQDLRSKDARLTLLAGNHDIRMMLGIRSVDLEPDPRTEHFFIRLGPKSVPFLKEIHDTYLQDDNELRLAPPEAECRRRLYPPQSWFEEFPRLAGWVMPQSGIEREVKRLRAKIKDFETACAKAGLSLRMVFAAARKWQQLFLDDQGEFAWFFRDMQLAYRAGSLLFIHAGLDDRAATLIGDKGVGSMNRLFREQINGDLFEFYYGSLANTIRTKYREVDMPLTKRGARALRKRGIQAIVHGHLNLLNGQRIVVRQGLVNFECDTTLDRRTRKKEGLEGPGAGVTLFHPQGHVLGISTDHPYIKVFNPASLPCDRAGS